jgi:hypothetical protein
MDRLKLLTESAFFNRENAYLDVVAWGLVGVWVPSHPAIPAREFVHQVLMVKASVAHPAARFTLQTWRYLIGTQGPGTYCNPNNTFRPTHVQVFRSYLLSRHTLHTQQQVSPCIRADSDPCTCTYIKVQKYKLFFFWSFFSIPIWKHLNRKWRILKLFI